MHIDTDQHYAIGDIGAVGDHRGAMYITDPREDGPSLFFCTDCGFVASGSRSLHDTECDPENGPTAVTPTGGVLDE